MTGGGEEGATGPVGLLDRVRVYVVVVGLGMPALLGVAALVLSAVPRKWGEVFYGLFALTALLLVILAIARGKHIRGLLGSKLRPLTDATVLGVLAACLGLYNWSLDRMFVVKCSHPPSEVAFAEPEILGLFALHGLGALAYVISRRRPDALRGLAEPLVPACMIAGMVVHALMTAQLGRGVLLSLFPPLLPLGAPPLTILIYADEAVSRLRRRGAEIAASPPLAPRGFAFRAGPPQVSLPPPPRVHPGLLARALALAVVILVGWSAAQKALLGWSPSQVFTRTLGWTFSTLPDPGPCTD